MSIATWGLAAALGLTCSLSGSGLARAEDRGSVPVNTGIGGGGAEDVLKMTKPMEAPPSQIRMKVSTSCTTSTGKKVAKGESGYDECMADAARDASAEASGAPRLKKR
ncbi:MAG: hypothetical protein AB7P04_10355 [Bacteriovoracia bacterium]